MTVHNRRCDCCGDRLSLVPSEIYPGEQYIARGGLGVGAPAAPAERPLSTLPGRGATPRPRPAHGITRTGRSSATGPPTLGPGRDTLRHSSSALLPPPSCRRPPSAVLCDRGWPPGPETTPRRQRPLQAAGDPPRRGPQGVDQAVPPGCAIPGGAYPLPTPGRHRPADTARQTPPWHTDGATQAPEHGTPTTPTTGGPHA
jgi:hypothetical protein